MAMTELTKEQKAALVVSRMARTVAHHEAARGIVTHDMSKCRATLVDRAANAAVLNGSASVFALPDLAPGEARQFDLRLDVSAATCVTFEGLEDFEIDAADKTAAFAKSERGISITLPPGEFLFTFTENKFGTILITRREIAAVK